MRLMKWHLFGIVFVVLLGSLLHFAYDWSGQNEIVALISPVNESTWEHLKLLFTPMLLLTIIEYFSYGKNVPGFFLIRALSIIIGMITIVVTFYTYVGIIGKNYLWLDILTFVISVIVAYSFSYKFMNKSISSFIGSDYIGVATIIIILIAFVVFTFQPPHINLFLDPVTGSYGISS